MGVAGFVRHAFTRAVTARAGDGRQPVPAPTASGGRVVRLGSGTALPVRLRPFAVDVFPKPVRQSPTLTPL
jgi:hypothetical protein